MPAIIIARLLYIQVLNHPKFEQMANKQVSEKKEKNSERGIIYDRNMDILAMNVTAVSLAANPRQITNTAKFAKDVSEISGIPESLIVEKIKSRKDSYFVWLKRQIIDETKCYDDESIEGLRTVSEQRRYYPYGAVTAKIVGVADVDAKGLSAMEKVHDKFSVMKKTIEDYKKLGKGGKIKISPDILECRVNVVSTIDAKLQYIAAKEIEETAQKFKAKSAFAVIQDPSNGEILALACWPSFNPNEYSYATEDLNVAGFQEVYEPALHLS